MADHRRTGVDNKRRRLKLADQNFIMNTALLECSIKENVSMDSLRIFQGKSGAWYIISVAKKANGTPEKVYFKKTF